MGKTQNLVLFALATLLSASFAGCIEPVKEIINPDDNRGLMPEPVIDREPIDPDDYPKLQMAPRARGAPALVSYSACDDLLDDLRESVFDEALVALEQAAYWEFLYFGNRYYWAEDGIAVGATDEGSAEMAEADSAGDGSVPPTASQDSSSPGDDRSGANDGERIEGEDYSGTNNQEGGVEEADFLKTDGDWIYLLNNDRLVILGVPEFGELNLTSNMTIEGQPTEMMLSNDRLVIISNVYAYQLESTDPIRSGMLVDDSTYQYRWQSLVKFTVIDITNRSDPQIERQIYLEGNQISARMVNGTVRAVSHISTWIDGLRTYPDLPDDYWRVEDREEAMGIWNRSVQDVLTRNRQIVDALTLDDFAPRLHERTAAGVVSHPMSSQDCSEFAATAGSSGRGFTTITTIGLLSEIVQVETDHITSTWAQVYASQDMMILAEPANDWWWYWRNSDFRDETNIHAFDISNPSSTTYLGSGRVDGTVQDQFSMSEHNGSIRIASTSSDWGRWWMGGVGIAIDMEEDIAVAETAVSTESRQAADERRIEPAPAPECEGTENRVTILRAADNGSLEESGKVEGIACGETIWSARFVGDRGYLVTFRNIDPLWVLDLSDPTEPTILGELEVPGVSTYIHPVDENTLMTIGIGPGEDGLGLDWSTTQISLFDVSDPSTPRLAAAMPLSPGYTDADCQNVRNCGWSWSWSEATYEHKAFTYWSAKELLAVPMSTHRYVYDTVTIDGRTYSYSGYEFVSMLKLISVDAENQTLSAHGELNHSGFYNGGDGYGGWWSGSTSIRRSIFMGDFVYAFSTAGVTVHSVNDLALRATIDLPGYDRVEPHAYESASTEDRPADSGSSTATGDEDRKS